MTVNDAGTILLKGGLHNVVVADIELDLIFSSADRNSAAATGVAAAAMGLSGLAAGALDAALADEKLPMKKVCFELDGKKVHALLWDFPFKDGDIVEVVAERDEGGYRAFAVACPANRIIAVYPYSTSGVLAHLINSARIFSYFCIFVIVPFCLLIFFVFPPGRDGASLLDFILAVGAVSVVFFGVIAANLSRKLFPFSRMAERIFTTLGFADVRRVNLRRLTKKLRRPDDPPALGDTYFRY